MSTTTAWLKTAKATPMQIVIAFSAIFYFIIADTAIYQENMPDIWKTVIYAGILTASILTGMSLTQSKELAKQVKIIGRDKTKSNDQKVEEILDVVDDALYSVKKLIKKE